MEWEPIYLLMEIDTKGAGKISNLLGNFIRQYFKSKLIAYFIYIFRGIKIRYLLS